MKDVITNLTITPDVTLITLANAPSDAIIISKIFNALGEKLNIDMISMTPPYKESISISFTIHDEDLNEAIKIINELKQKYIENLRLDVNSTNSKISLYGDAMKHTPGVFAKTLDLLSEEEIEIKLITTSEVDISYLIFASDETRVVDTILNYFDHVEVTVE
ncbi:ACT domain-containing protein [Vallitalea okinawensis]|uniref:ACT domain-containing protein n=1 Tax=Vallitalea okinawensis TaxID=2078660 RepID=UPI000CFC380C|nr:ACT domain-containing protein [Vallitalea okinawensis]